VIDEPVELDVDATVDSLTVTETGFLRFDPTTSHTLESKGNVVVDGGVLQMHPDAYSVVHTLRFIDVNEANFVGGHTDVPLATDVGLWVEHGGRLDAIGSTRDGWNRTGTSATWQTGDEVLAAPHQPPGHADFLTFSAFTPGDPVPRAYDEVPPTEILNLTRNVRIEGTESGRSHVMICCGEEFATGEHQHHGVPQTIKYVQFRHMGVPVAGADFGGLNSGRYPLHFHRMGYDSAGSLIEGCVIRDGGAHGYVTHLSNDVIYRDCIVYSNDGNGYWWDPLSEGSCRPQDGPPWAMGCNMTLGVRYEHCMAALIGPGNTTDLSGMTGFLQQQGLDMFCLDCVAVGVGGRNVSSGFHWPSKANHSANVWIMEDCVGHNNRGSGIFTWQNDANGHIVDRFVAYHNGRSGIDHGAYGNPYNYRDSIMVANNGLQPGHTFPTQWIQHSSSRENPVTGLPMGWYGNKVHTKGRPGPCLQIHKHNVPSNPADLPVVFKDIEFFPTTAEPVVEVREREGGAFCYKWFVHCTVEDDPEPRDLEPEDFDVIENAQECIILGQRRDNTAWRINANGTITDPVDPFWSE
jgi:hypothetical protein